MKTLIDGQGIAKKINSETKAQATKLRKQGIVPKLAVVLVGNNKASEVYVRQKQAIAKSVGVDFSLHKIPSAITLNRFKQIIKKIQTDAKLSALIVQLPLPEKLYTRELLNVIRPNLDIDFLTDANLGTLISKTNTLEPPTAGAMLEILRSLKIFPKGKQVVVIGAGALVGRPLALLLLNERATVTVCNTATQNLPELCKQADIIMSCVGKRNLVRGNMVKRGAVVIDAGFVFENNKVSGDVNVIEVAKVARYVTPTPGGVGPITVAKLLKNVVLNAERFKK